MLVSIRIIRYLLFCLPLFYLFFSFSTCYGFNDVNRSFHYIVKKIIGESERAYLYMWTCLRHFYISRHTFVARKTECICVLEN